MVAYENIFNRTLDKRKSEWTFEKIHIDNHYKTICGPDQSEVSNLPAGYIADLSYKHHIN